MNETALNKIHRFYWKEVIGSTNARKDGLRQILNLFCDKLDIDPPSLYLCDVSRQNECIEKKERAPCGGGCYGNDRIFIREIYGGMDTLLHELFHHVNKLNGNNAIKQIMKNWVIQEFEITKGYGELLRKHNIPMRKPKWA